MHCLQKIKYFFALILLLMTLPAMADGVRTVHADGFKTSNGNLNIRTRFYITLPQQLEQALKQGVSLYFNLDTQITRPTIMTYKFKFNNMIGGKKNISYKLTYLPTTNRYKISIGTFYTEYHSLEAALSALGSTKNWKVIEDNALKDYSAKDISFSVRLSLDTKKLPKPFQINAITSNTWNLNSGWVLVNILGN